MTRPISHSARRRVVAATAALALGVLGIFGITGTASAAPIGDVGNITSPDTSTSQIIVHKYEKTSTNGTDPGTGLPATPTGNPIPGVTFNVKEVLDSAASLPLLTNPGWVRANTINSAFVPTNAEASLTGQAGVTLTAGTSIVTNASGIATFGSLHYGLYLVQETAAPAQVTDPARPFLVTVPFPTGASNPTNSNEWLYNVNVYPKNGVTQLTKAVNTTDAAFHTAADYVSWTITADVPVLTSGGFNPFTVSDTINPAQLSFVTVAPPVGISPRAIRVLNAGGTDVTANFALTTDYTFTINGTNDVQTLAFTSTGRADLVTYAQGGKVEFIVPTKLVAAPANGNVVNLTNSVVNSGTRNSSSNTDFGKLRVFKFATTTATSPSQQTPLAGAKFQVYYDASNIGVADAGELVTVNGINEWTSDGTGLLNVPALKPGAYLLVETAAPVGYQALSAPVAVTVMAGDVVTTAGSEVNYLEIENSQVPPWQLPFTGGNGPLTFTLIGIALMSLAFGLALVAVRRRQAKA